MSQLAEPHFSAIPQSLETAEARPRLGALYWVLVLFIAVTWLQTVRQALWYFGFPVPIRTLATVLGTSLPFISLAAVYVASISLPPAPSRQAYGMRVWLLLLWGVALLGLGLLEGYAAPYAVFKEFLGFVILFSMLLIGRRDQVWKALKKPMVIVVYLSLAVIVLTLHAPAAIMTAEGFVAGKSLQAPRNLDTVAYACRGAMDLAPMLFAWGMSTTRKDVWRLLMIGAIAVYVGVEAIVFQFRGSAAAALFVVLVYAATSSFVRSRIPIGALLALFFVSGIGFVVASQTQGFSKLIDRFGEGGGILDSRIDEAQYFFKDMGLLDLVIGRGLAGNYAGPPWAPMSEYDNRLVWSANHFGFLGFVLRGGFLLLIFAATFVVPYFLPKPTGWSRSEYNVAALITVPLLLFNIVFNPFDFYPDSTWGFLMWGLCFGRLSTFGPENAWQTTPESINSES